jgi:hypothetical protein
MGGGQRRELKRCWAWLATGVMNAFAALVTFAMFAIGAYCAWNAFSAI